MARLSIRFLEVDVTYIEPNRWKWTVFESDVEVACGFETSRETAQIEGDSALSVLLSIGRP